MRFIVGIREAWIQEYTVEAKSKDEAIALVLDGEGEAGDLELSHTMDDPISYVKEV